jgi:small conductance mechanosensitive channel
VIESFTVPVLTLLAQDADAETDDQSDDESATGIDISCGNQGPLCDTLVEWTGNEQLGELIAYLISVPLKILFIIGLSLVINRAARRAVPRLIDWIGTTTAEHGDALVSDRSVDRAEERAETTSSLLRSLSSALIFGAAVALSLEVVGINVTAAIAGAGVLSIAVGFGAQSVVEDLLRGFFMLAEDQFGVGDRIDVGVVDGTVERITPRTTVIRDPVGTLWHVPNSEINYVANEAQTNSRATVIIGVSYDADITRAVDVLTSAAEEAAADPDWEGVVTRTPNVQGVQELGDDAVNIRVIAWVEAEERRGFERHLRQSLKEALDAADIELPNRQVDVWLRDQD